MQWTVLNDGSVSTLDWTTNNNWTDSVYLSRDPYLDQINDIPLGNKQHTDVLSTNETYTNTLAGKLLDWVSGPYYIIMFTDSSVPDHVFER